MPRKPNRAPASIDRWSRQVQHDLRFARKTLIDQGEITNMFVIHPHGDDPAMVIAVPWHDDESKIKCLNMVKLMCIAHDAEALSHIGEGWIRNMTQRANETEAEMRERATAIRPSQSEDRLEVVTVTITWLDETTGERRSLARWREIERRSNSGKPVGLKLIDGVKDEETAFTIEGLITETLPNRRPLPEEKLRAKTILDALAAKGTAPTEH